MGTEIEDWRQQIEAVTPPLGDKIARTALEFLDTEHARQAADLGWSKLQLFGLHSGDLKVATLRSDAKGLVPFIALALHTYSIVAIERDRALVQTSGGAVQTWPRHRPAEDLAIPFWEHSVFLGKAAVSFE
jgi:hypothetical protein